LNIKLSFELFSLFLLKALSVIGEVCLALGFNRSDSDWQSTLLNIDNQGLMISFLFSVIFHVRTWDVSGTRGSYEICLQKGWQCDKGTILTWSKTHPRFHAMV